jgi:methyl-accepting chemotaxis protein
MYNMARVYDAANYASINSLPSVLVLTDASNAESSLSADIWNHLAQSDPARLAGIEKKITDDRRAVDVALAKYEPLLSDDKDRALLAADRAALVAYDGVKERVLDLSRAGKKAEGRDLWVGSQSVSDDIGRRLDAHQKYNLELATQGSDEGVRVKSAALRHAILVACLTLLLVAAVGFAIARSILRPLQQAVGVLSAIGQGRLDSQVIVTSSDETGQMLGALDAMQRNLKERTDQERAVANENGRIKCALDRASASVMLTDENLNIIYSNEAAQQLFRANQADFKRDLPNFDAERIVGSNIDIFHRNPAHQRHMLASLQGTHTAEIRLGGHAMRIAASPVAGSDGKRTGLWWSGGTVPRRFVRKRK